MLLTGHEVGLYQAHSCFFFPLWLSALSICRLRFTRQSSAPMAPLLPQHHRTEKFVRSILPFSVFDICSFEQISYVSADYFNSRLFFNNFFFSPDPLDLWNTYGDCENFAVLSGHTNAIMELAWSHDGTQLYSASVDKSCGVWDAEVGLRVRRFRGHTSFVNACCGAR